MTQTNKKFILCVDDEKMVLNALTTQIHQEFGNYFIVETAESAPEARDIIQEILDEQNKLALIISDWLMPIEKGDQFLMDISQRYKDIPLMMLSGHIDDATLEKTKNYTSLKAFMRKPWDKQELVENIRKWAL